MFYSVGNQCNRWGFRDKGLKSAFQPIAGSAVSQQQERQPQSSQAHQMKCPPPRFRAKGKNCVLSGDLEDHATLKRRKTSK